MHKKGENNNKHTKQNKQKRFRLKKKMNKY